MCAKIKGIIAFLLLSVFAVNGAVLTRQSGLRVPRQIQVTDKHLIGPGLEGEGYVATYFMYSYLREQVDSPLQLNDIRANPNAVHTIFAGKWTQEFQDGVVALLTKYPLTLLDNQEAKREVAQKAMQNHGVTNDSISYLLKALSTLLDLSSSAAQNATAAVQPVVQTVFDSAQADEDLAADAAAEQLLKFLRPFKLALGKVYDRVVTEVNTIRARPAQTKI